MNNGCTVPKATLGRLPQYLQFLREMADQEGTISATAIARGLSLGDVQVRKDLAVISGSGKPKVGYVTRKLIQDIETCLGYSQWTNAVLVGAGKLGKALLEYDGFEKFGIRILAAFDCNESVVRVGKNEKSIFPVRMLNAFCKENHVKIGIITVGQDAAQNICDQLVAEGITAVWNFAPCVLRVPDGVVIQQENLALSLAYLNSQISK